MKSVTRRRIWFSSVTLLYALLVIAIFLVNRFTAPEIAQYRGTTVKVWK